MKKFVAFLLTMALVGSLGVSTIGCGKKDEKKDTKPPANGKTDKKDTK